MAAQKLSKVTKKELQAPDEFQESMAKVVEFFRLYGAWVGAGAAVIVIAIIGGVMLSRMSTTRGIEKSDAFLKAASPLAVQAVQKEQQDDADATKKDAEDQQNRARQALADLDKFLADNAKSDLKNLALLAKGSAMLKAGDAPGASAAWKAFLDANPNSPYAWLAWEAFGIAADQAGNRADAEKAFLEMSKVDSGLARAYGLLHLGDLYNPLAKVRPDDPADAAKAKDFYQKGLDALNGPVDRMPGPQLVLRKTLEERAQAVR